MLPGESHERQDNDGEAPFTERLKKTGRYLLKAQAEAARDRKSYPIRVYNSRRSGMSNK